MRLKPTHTYEVIAAALKASRPLPLMSMIAGQSALPVASADDAARIQWEHDVRAMAHALRADNRNFKLDLFFEQCGLHDE